MAPKPGHEVPCPPRKSALGIMPEWLYEEKRINELARAIERQLKGDRPDAKLIAKWSDEINRRALMLDARE